MVYTGPIAPLSLFYNVSANMKTSHVNIQNGVKLVDQTQTNLHCLYHDYKL